MTIQNKSVFLEKSRLSKYQHLKRYQLSNLLRLWGLVSCQEGNRPAVSLQPNQLMSPTLLREHQIRQRDREVVAQAVKCPFKIVYIPNCRPLDRRSRSHQLAVAWVLVRMQVKISNDLRKRIFWAIWLWRLRTTIWKITCIIKKIKHRRMNQMVLRPEHWLMLSAVKYLLR